MPQGANSQVQMKQLVIGAEGYEKTSPFLFLSEDWFAPPGGFETHPHRGIQTVTIVLEGTLEHKDHTGAHGILNAGDVQWMTAGQGVLHSEMPKGQVHTLQLWLNLPAKMKMIPARYQDQRLKDVPTNGEVRVYAGKSGNVEHGHGSDYPMWLLEIRGPAEQEMPASYRGFVYVLEGQIIMQLKGQPAVTLSAGQTFYEGPTDVHVVGRNASNTAPARFVVVLLKGKGAPILTPVNE